MNSYKKRYLMETLFRKCKGRCTNCNVKLGMVHQLIKKGWEWLQREGLLISPTNEILFVATLEHLHPKGKGGQDNIKNLTLYCEHCNRKTAHLGMHKEQSNALY